MITCKVTMDASSVMEQEELREGLARILTTLTSTEQEVIRLRFGFDGKPHNFPQIGVALGISADRARTIAQRGVRKLQQPIRRRHVENYLFGECRW